MCFIVSVKEGKEIMTNLRFAAQLAMLTHKFNFWKYMYVKSMNYIYCHGQGREWGYGVDK